MVTKRLDLGGVDVDGHRGGKVGLSVLDFDLRVWQTEQYRIHSSGFSVIPEYYVYWQTLCGLNCLNFRS